MSPHTSAALAGIALAALAVLAAGCTDPAADRVPPVSAPQPPASSPLPSLTAVPPPSPLPSLTAVPPPSPMLTSAPEHPFPMATSLAEPMATGAPLTATGPPRFFVSARTPLARFPGRSKTAVLTPVPPAVHNAETGAFIANIPLPPGIEGSWHLVDAAPDNRTFAIAGWTEPTNSGIRFFVVRLGEDGRPGKPVAITQADPDYLDLVYDLALSPDGTRLAYATPLIGGGAKISVLDVATGRRLDWKTSTHPGVSGLSWAPDGRSLAYVLGHRSIALLDLARLGTDPDDAVSRIVMNTTGAPPSALESVAHTPDGSALIYSSGHTIERVPLAGGPAQVLARPELPPGASLTLRFNIDGTGEHLLYVHKWRAYRAGLTDGAITSVPITVDEHPGKGGSLRAAW
ncbi:WD40 repeat domain-containing protein [Streptosporangium sp. H16]|uniref:WD40 repeat domain-containing protein n=1 Tax=Streptosporangium sp. H16 TaxID=3444184 RepID=UPI003F79D6E8